MKEKLKNFWLVIRFPFLLPDGDWDMSYTKLDFMPKGWRETFGIQMCRDIKKELLRNGGAKELLRYRILEIKEKYGGLRWYDNGYMEGSKIPDIIDYYEDLSMCYCLNCGNPVRYITKGYIGYLCLVCFEHSIEHLPEDKKKLYRKSCRLDKSFIPKRSNQTGVDFEKLWRVTS